MKKLLRKDRLLPIIVLRAKYKISQKELAKHIGVCKKTVSYTETKKIIPNVVTMLKIAQFFNVSVEELVEEEY